MCAPRRTSAPGTTRAPRFCNSSMLAAVGEAQRHLVERLRRTTVDHAVVVDAEVQQYRLLDPLVHRPATLAIRFGDTTLTRFEQVKDLAQRWKPKMGPRSRSGSARCGARRRHRSGFQWIAWGADSLVEGGRKTDALGLVVKSTCCDGRCRSTGDIRPRLCTKERQFHPPLTRSGGTLNGQLRQVAFQSRQVFLCNPYHPWEYRK